MNPLTRFKTTLKTFIFAVGISPLLSLISLLLHIASTILILISGATLREILLTLDALLLILLLCFVDFNVLRSPLQRQHAENLKRAAYDQTENRPRKDDSNRRENP